MDNVMQMENKEENPRNYEIDFFKLIFAMLVFIAHSSFFMSADAKLPPMLGSISVHFFFIVSGMLMANSIHKSKCDSEVAAENAISFIVKKIKKIMFPYWVSLFVFILVYIYAYT